MRRKEHHLSSTLQALRSEDCKECSLQAFQEDSQLEFTGVHQELYTIVSSNQVKQSRLNSS